MFEFEARSRAEMLRDMLSTPVEIVPWPSPPPPAAQGNANPPKLITAKEAAKVLGICDKSLWNATNRGEIPSVKLGRSVRYDPRDLSRWIETNKTRGGKPATSG